MVEKIVGHFKGVLKMSGPDPKKGFDWRITLNGRTIDIATILVRVQREISKQINPTSASFKEDLDFLSEIHAAQSDPKKMDALEQALEETLLAAYKAPPTLKSMDADKSVQDDAPLPSATELDKALDYYWSTKRPSDNRREVDDFLVHRETMQVYRDVSITAWARRMNVNLKTLVAKSADPAYLPRGPVGIIPSEEEEGRDLINSYRRPIYFALIPDIDVKSPMYRKTVSLFERYIEHLFPWEVEREYFKDWVYQSLFDRSKTYLVLCGRPGIGKTVLSSVLKGLHGESNAVDGKASTLTERFNGQLSESTLIWFDEIRYSRDSNALENLKQNQNDTVSVESKGVDANRGQQIFASMVLSNNYVSHNAFSYDDRKFAPLVLTEKRLEDVFTQAEISFLSSGFFEGSSEYSPEAVASLYVYLRDRGFVGKHGKKKWNSKTMEFYSPMFYSMCYWNMSNWAKACLDWVMENVPSGKYTTFGTIPKDKNIDKDPKYVEGLDKELRKVLGKQRVPREVVVRDGLSNIKDMEGTAIFKIEILCEETGALKIGLTKKADKFKLSDTYLRPEGATEDSDEEVKF